MAIAQAFESQMLHAVITERDELRDRLMCEQTGVTVCVPCYMQSEWLPEALASINAQTVKTLEVIVVDDGSELGEGQRIREISEAHGARYVRVTNRGLAAARNTGIMLAKGSAFLPLDADDWLREDYLEKTVPLLAEADVVLTGLQEHGPTRNGCYMPGYDRPFDQVTEEVLWSYNRFFYASLFRTRALREIGGYNSRMSGGWGQHADGGYEDWTTWIDLVRRGARFAAVVEPLFNYRTRSDGMLAAAERNRAALVEEMRRHHDVS